MYRDLIGVKFTVHGRSIEEGFDCYGLAIEVLRRNGITLPDVFYDNLDTRKELHEELHASIPHQKIENPEKNCIIEIAVHGEPIHIGVYIGYGLVIHTTYKTGVIIEPLAHFRKRILGCYKVSSN